MITNLQKYNNQKRSLLDRLTFKYAGYLSDILIQNIENQSSKIESAIISGKDKVSINVKSLESKLFEVMDDHRKYTVFVGVSDAMREETKHKNLSWNDFPENLPIELTFNETSLAELTKRNLVTNLINKRISKKSKSIIEQILDQKINSYLKTIQSVYDLASRSYREDETSKDTRKRVIKIIQEITDRSKRQAEVIFRTETTRYFNQSRVEYFTKYSDTDFIQLVAVTDGRISNICESRDMYVIPIKDANLKKFKPPFHPNCRTIQSPLDTSLKSDAQEVSKNLGSEFGKIKSKTSGKEFTGKREKPNIPLPKGWA